MRKEVCPINKKVCEASDCNERHTNKTFCSRECQITWMRTDMEGEEALNYRGGKTVECHNPSCSESVYRKPSELSKDKNHFCSSSCLADWHSENSAGEQSYLWKGGGVQKTCPVCEDEFTVKQSHAERRRCCSRACYGEWQSEHRTGSKVHNWKERVLLTCETCEEEYQVRPSRKDSRFCSAECQYDWLGQTYRGENHPNWNGGKIGYYGPNWRQQRRKARERDNHTCQYCGKSRTEIGQEPDVHHITPFRECPDYNTANKLSNLIYLCRGCHNKVEGEHREQAAFLRCRITSGGEQTESVA